METSQDVRQHYAALLGLVPPWVVTAVELNVDGKIVEIDVQWPPDQSVPCPACQQPCTIKDHREERRWRHLDTMQFQTIVKSRVPRSECLDHGVKTIAVPWAGPHSRFTLLFERFAIDVLLAAKSLTHAATLLGLSWDQLQQIQARAVERGVMRRDLGSIQYVGMDEKSFLQGHQYASLLTDISGARVLEVVQDRTLEAADTLWGTLPETTRQNIRAVAIDMWDAYITSATHQVPQADIVHDKFHIAKYLSEAVDHVRRAEHKTLMQSKDETLKGAKYLFLKHPANMTAEEQQRFDALRLDTLKAGRAWAIKETFTAFWDYASPAWATKFFQRWYWWATHSRLVPMIAVAKKIARHFDHILTSLKHGITNGMMEGFNSKIQSLKANARGYRNFGHYRIVILFNCGKLDLYP
jgi:transposase